MSVDAANNSYLTIGGRSFNLSSLTLAEENFLRAVFEKYRTQPEWTNFDSWWINKFMDSDLPERSCVHRICHDLGARLGIAQGKVALPDFRDTLNDLIEERYGSRENFCRATEIPSSLLGRLFASRSDVTLEEITPLLQILGCTLILSPEEEIRIQCTPEKAIVVLAQLKA